MAAPCRVILSTQAEEAVQLGVQRSEVDGPWGDEEGRPALEPGKHVEHGRPQQHEQSWPVAVAVGDAQACIPEYHLHSLHGCQGCSDVHTDSGYARCVRRVQLTG